MITLCCTAAGGAGGFLEFCKLFWKSLLLNYFQFSLLHFLLFCSLLLSWVIFLVLLCLSATPRSIFFPQLCYLVSLSSSTSGFLVLLFLSSTPRVILLRSSYLFLFLLQVVSGVLTLFRILSIFSITFLFQSFSPFHAFDTSSQSHTVQGYFPALSVLCIFLIKLKHYKIQPNK